MLAWVMESCRRICSGPSLVDGLLTKGMKTGCHSARGCPVSCPGPKSSRSSTGGCEKWGEKRAEAEKNPSSSALFRVVGTHEQVVQGNEPQQVSQRGDHPQPHQTQAAWGHQLPLTHVKT